MVLIGHEQRGRGSPRQESFRPLTGIMVLIGNYYSLEGFEGTLCFRPLTGIMVLIPLPYFIEYQIKTIVFPSPYGDYGSYLMPMVL